MDTDPGHSGVRGPGPPVREYCLRPLPDQVSGREMGLLYLGLVLTYAGRCVYVCVRVYCAHVYEGVKCIHVCRTRVTENTQVCLCTQMCVYCSFKLKKTVFKLN